MPSRVFPKLRWYSCLICTMSISQRVTMIRTRVSSFVPAPYHIQHNKQVENLLNLLQISKCGFHGNHSGDTSNICPYGTEGPVAGSRVGLGGFKPTHFQKKAPMRLSQIRRLLGGWGVGGGGLGGGRVEREKAWAVSDCVKQTATSTRCYYSVQLRSLIYCSDHCRFWNPIQSRFA